MAVKLWSGQSPVDGAPIMAAMTYGNTSQNRKTGRVDTLWILREDIPPHEAVKGGEDRSICGDCPHRRGEGSLGDCYVLPFKAPLSVWRSCHGEKVQGDFHPSTRWLRLGGYGDPAMLPRDLVRNLSKRYGNTLGYTHQWREPFAQWAKRFCMASVGSLEEAREAQLQGWRTFRVRYALDIPLKSETACPNTRNPLITCDTCGLCNGTGGGDFAVEQVRKSGKSVTVMAHGSKSRQLLKV